jgi:NADH dehydrogenase FAD-containing subunit
MPGIRTKVIIGGGFGGLETVFSLLYLRRESTDITLIGRKECHFFINSSAFSLSPTNSVCYK